ncbi:MAG: NAD-dependent epimerase/dehydratase family protein [Flavobacteriales bacterium TMED84]|nr:MAG: NAD-dependent epimerase/dehydratase family protein [Flavobacteriales bacterium TMED84]
MKILITGGAGFIGSNLVSLLSNLNYEITVIDSLLKQVHGKRQESFSYFQILGKCKFVKSDVNDNSVFKRLLLDSEILIHLASQTGTGQSMYEKDLYEKSNVIGTENIYKLLNENRNNIKKIILTSSRSVYGEGEYEYLDGTSYTNSKFKRNKLDLKEDFDFYCHKTNKKLRPIATKETSRLAPKSYYAETKLRQEHIVKKINKELGINCIILRLQNVYGEGQSLINPYTGILSIFSNRILTSSRIEIFEDGQQTRDFVHVSDVVSIIKKIIDDEVKNKLLIYNVGSGSRTKIIDVVENLYEYFKKKKNYVVTGKHRKGDIRHNFSDISKIKNDYKFSISVDFNEGINRYIDWVKNQDIVENNYENTLNELRQKGLLE